MTDKQSSLAWLLMQPKHYMIESTNSAGRSVYKVYEGNHNPVQYFSQSCGQKFLKFLKVDHKKRMTLNLRLVRQLRGNNYLKMLYKKRKTNEKN